MLGAEGKQKGREAIETCHPPPVPANTAKTYTSVVGDRLCASKSSNLQGTIGTDMCLLEKKKKTKYMLVVWGSQKAAVSKISKLLFSQLYREAAPG